MIKTKNTQFDVFGGAGYNQEFFGAYTLPNPTPPPATTPFPAVTQRNAEAIVGEQFDTKLGSRSTFSETFNYFPNISGPSGYRFTFNTVFSTAISKWLGWQFSFNDTFFSNPPTGIKGNDLLLSTGLRLTFGSAEIACTWVSGQYSSASGEMTGSILRMASRRIGTKRTTLPKRISSEDRRIRR